MIEITDSMCESQEGCLICYLHSDCDRDFKEIVNP